MFKVWHRIQISLNKKSSNKTVITIEVHRLVQPLLQARSIAWQNWHDKPYKVDITFNWSGWNIAAKNEECWEMIEEDPWTVPKSSHASFILSHSLFYIYMQDIQKWVNQMHSCRETFFWDCVIPERKIKFSSK